MAFNIELINTEVNPNFTLKLIFFSSRSTLVQAQFFPENFLNKRCELQFFS